MPLLVFFTVCVDRSSLAVLIYEINLNTMMLSYVSRPGLHSANILPVLHTHGIESTVNFLK